MVFVITPNTASAGSYIELYADGSFCHELCIGAWAFSIPRLDIIRSGSSEGSTSTRFELLAVLYGLEEILSVDTSEAPLHVFSDCDSTVAVLNRLRDGKRLEKPARYEDRADLLPRLAGVFERRLVSVTRHTGRNLHHQVCHRNARERLREEIAREPKAGYRLALMRQCARHVQLTKDREEILNRLAAVDEEIDVVRPQIEALECFLSCVDAHSTTAVREILTLAGGAGSSVRPHNIEPPTRMHEA